MARFHSFYVLFLGGISTVCKEGNDCPVSDMISIKISMGTCAQITDTRTGQLFVIKKDIKDTDYYYNGLLSSCTTETRNVLCPEGTFVKRIEWDEKSNLKQGIRLSCLKPDTTSVDKAVVVSTHQASSFTKSKIVECSSFTELTLTHNTTFDSDIALNVGKSCVAEKINVAETTLECQSFTALTGIIVSVELSSEYF